MGEPASRAQGSTLVDRFGRQVTYLRVSVTDRCDLRCVYCMGEDMQFLPRAQLLTLEEILAIGGAFVDLGVRKIRVTGGEPLVRRNVTWLLRELASLPGLDEVVLTTNGTRLERLAGEIREAGVRRLNVSLDTLRPERFRRMTRVGQLDRVLRGIETAREAGFRRIRLNAVILRGYNDDEVTDLVAFAVERAMDIAFIEEMPLGLVGDHDRAAVYCSSDEVRAMVEARYPLLSTTERTGGPAVYFRVADTPTHVGFISPHSHNFCDTCNRVRLTTEGRLLLCLGQEHSVDLRRVVRANPGDAEALRAAIRDSMAIKPLGHEFALRGVPVILRHMSVTGG
jgi:cyclic pyranopterin phosphate synthase